MIIFRYDFMFATDHDGGRSLNPSLYDWETLTNSLVSMATLIYCKDSMVFKAQSMWLTSTFSTYFVYAQTVRERYIQILTDWDCGF